jgi:DNA-binding transcriptional ArsR family regulator
MSPAPNKKLRARPRNLAPIFSALGDETRLSIVRQLAGGQARSIAQLTQGSKITRQAVTKHLRILEEAGIVESLRSGRENLFQFHPQSIDEMRDYLELVSSQWDDALTRLKSFVED